jgi:hypothetical protein
MSTAVLSLRRRGDRLHQVADLLLVEVRRDVRLADDPDQLWSSITGSRRTLCSVIVRTASSVESSAPIVTTLLSARTRGL